jgi:hypothetical protein
MSTYRAELLEQRFQVIYCVQNKKLELFKGTIKEVILTIVNGKVSSSHHFVVFDESDQVWLNLDHYVYFWSILALVWHQQG